MSRYAFWLLMLLPALAACNPSVSVGVKIDWDDPCLLAFPSCGGTCADSTGATVPGCIPACVAARELWCDSEGPHCIQTLGTGEVIEVPILCVNPEVYRP